MKSSNDRKVARTLVPKKKLKYAKRQRRDRFASSGRGISSAGSRIGAIETIDQTETGRRWLTMFTFLRLQLKYKNG